ncbi:MAG: MmcB family DNA repair protein [Candidatus Velthaea sp.]
MLDYIPLTPIAGKKRTTAELRDLARERMSRLGYPFVASEFSPAGSGCRFDVIGVGRYTRQVRIYEVKSSRGDYLADTKWHRYLDFCTHFAFVAPAGAIQRWELDRDVGLIEYGHPMLERMLANRRFGFTIHRDDVLRSSRPSRRLRDAVGDTEWLALLEAIAFGTATRIEHDPTFADGAGI